MFFRRLFKVFVFVLSILAVNLLTAHLDNHLVAYRGQYDALTFTLLGMGVIVLIFYPLMAWMDGGVERVSQAFLGFGKRLIGRKLGMILAFLVGFYGLLYCYGELWFGMNLHPLVMAKAEALFHLVANRGRVGS